jgi:type I restriction enzyme, S subunit
VEISKTSNNPGPPEKSLTDLPQTWLLVDIDSIAYVTKLAGFEYTKYVKLSDCGEVPVIRAQNVRMGNFVEENIKYISRDVSDLLVRSQVNGNEILMVFIGAGTGDVCLAPNGRRWHLAPNVAKIDVKDCIDREYLCFYLQSPLGLAETLSWAKSTAQPSLSMETIRKIKVPLPPLEEQNRIASIFNTIQGLIQKTNQIIEQTLRLKNGLMQKLLTRGIRHSRFKETEIGKIPEEWNVTTLGDNIKLQGGYAFKSTDYVDDGVNLIRITNVSFGNIIERELAKLPYDYLTKYKEFSLSNNDILIVLTRPITEGGIKVAKVNSHLPALLNQRVGRFKIINGDKILSGFLFYLFFSNTFIKYMKERLGTTHQPNISPSEIEKYSVPLPSIEEQRNIMSILSSVDRKISILRDEGMKIKLLKNGLMQNLLTGKIRVKA